MSKIFSANIEDVANRLHAPVPQDKPHPTLVQRRRHRLVHLADELVDVGFPVTEVTALDVVLELAHSPSTSGVGQLEGP